MNAENNLSLDQAATLALQKHLAGQYQESADIVEAILKQNNSMLIPLYLRALHLYLAKNEVEAKNLMNQIDQAMPELQKFHYKQSLLEQQDLNNWFTIQNTRLIEFCQFNNVECFIISYPKCGRTWLRMMLGKYLLNGQEGDPIELLNLTNQLKDVPTTELSHDDYPMWKHIDKMETDKSIYQNKKVVWLARDPRDAFVSYYFQHTKREDGKRANDDFDGSMGDFLTHPIGGLPSIIKFYNIWAKNLQVPKKTFVLTYEKIHEAPEAMLKALIEFLGYPNYGDEAIHAAVDYCQFDNMKKIEEQNLLNNPRLKAADGQDPEAFKVRKGKVGGYTEYLNDQEITQMEEYIQSHLDPFYKQLGYL